MATTEIHPIKATEIKAISYIINPDKTENGLFVNSFGCASEPEKAAGEFRLIRSVGTGRSTTLAQHLHQSFAPGEVTPEQAIEIGVQLAERFLKGQYQYVIATHTDKHHIHNHIVFNNVNFENGRSFEYLENRGGKAWKRLREISDELCMEHGLSVIENPEQGKGKCWFEWQQNRQGSSWKTKLKSVIDDAIMNSSSLDEFLREMDKRNVAVIYRPEHKISLKFRMREDGQEKYTRARTLGWYYEPKQLEKRIREYTLFRNGQLPYQQHTRILDTTAEQFDTAPGLKHWAEIQNMKEASRVINFLTERGIQTQEELEQRAIAEYGKRIRVVGELNQLQTKIDTLSDTITQIRTYRKYKPIQEAYQKTPFRKKFRTENAPATRFSPGPQDAISLANSSTRRSKRRGLIMTS